MPRYGTPIMPFDGKRSKKWVEVGGGGRAVQVVRKVISGREEETINGGSSLFPCNVVR